MLKSLRLTMRALAVMACMTQMALACNIEFLASEVRSTFVIRATAANELKVTASDISNALNYDVTKTDCNVQFGVYYRRGSVCPNCDDSFDGAPGTFSWTATGYHGGSFPAVFGVIDSNTNKIYRSVGVYFIGQSATDTTSGTGQDSFTSALCQAMCTNQDRSNDCEPVTLIDNKESQTYQLGSWTVNILPDFCESSAYSQCYYFAAATVSSTVSLTSIQMDGTGMATIDTVNNSVEDFVSYRVTYYDGAVCTAALNQPALSCDADNPTLTISDQYFKKADSHPNYQMLILANSAIDMDCEATIRNQDGSVNVVAVTSGSVDGVNHFEPDGNMFRYTFNGPTVVPNWTMQFSHGTSSVQPASFKFVVCEYASPEAQTILTFKRGTETQELLTLPVWQSTADGCNTNVFGYSFTADASNGNDFLASGATMDGGGLSYSNSSPDITTTLYGLGNLDPGTYLFTYKLLNSDQTNQVYGSVTLSVVVEECYTEPQNGIQTATWEVDNDVEQSFRWDHLIYKDECASHWVRNIYRVRCESTDTVTGSPCEMTVEDAVTIDGLNTSAQDNCPCSRATINPHDRRFKVHQGVTPRATYNIYVWGWQENVTTIKPSAQYSLTAVIGPDCSADNPTLTISDQYFKKADSHPNYSMNLVANSAIDMDCQATIRNQDGSVNVVAVTSGSVDGVNHFEPDGNMFRYTFNGPTVVPNWTMQFSHGTSSVQPASFKFVVCEYASPEAQTILTFKRGTETQELLTLPVWQSTADGCNTNVFGYSLTADASNGNDFLALGATMDGGGLSYSNSSPDITTTLYGLGNLNPGTYQFTYKLLNSKQTDQVYDSVTLSVVVEECFAEPQNGLTSLTMPFTNDEDAEFQWQPMIYKNVCASNTVDFYRVKCTSFNIDSGESCVSIVGGLDQINGNDLTQQDSCACSRISINPTDLKFTVLTNTTPVGQYVLEVYGKKDGLTNPPSAQFTLTANVSINCQKAHPVVSLIDPIFFYNWVGGNEGAYTATGLPGNTDLDSSCLAYVTDSDRNRYEEGGGQLTRLNTGDFTFVTAIDSMFDGSLSYTFFHGTTGIDFEFLICYVLPSSLADVANPWVKLEPANYLDTQEFVLPEFQTTDPRCDGYYTATFDASILSAGGVTYNSAAVLDSQEFKVTLFGIHGNTLEEGRYDVAFNVLDGNGAEVIKSYDLVVEIPEKCNASSSERGYKYEYIALGTQHEVTWPVMIFEGNKCDHLTVDAYILHQFYEPELASPNTRCEVKFDSLTGDVTDSCVVPQGLKETSSSTVHRRFTINAAATEGLYSVYIYGYNSARVQITPDPVFQFHIKVGHTDCQKVDGDENPSLSWPTLPTSLEYTYKDDMVSVTFPLPTQDKAYCPVWGDKYEQLSIDKNMDGDFGSDDYDWMEVEQIEDESGNKVLQIRIQSDSNKYFVDENEMDNASRSKTVEVRVRVQYLDEESLSPTGIAITFKPGCSTIDLNERVVNPVSLFVGSESDEKLTGTQILELLDDSMDRIYCLAPTTDCYLKFVQSGLIYRGKSTCSVIDSDQQTEPVEFCLKREGSSFVKVQFKATYNQQVEDILGCSFDQAGECLADYQVNYHYNHPDDPLQPDGKIIEGQVTFKYNPDYETKPVLSCTLLELLAPTDFTKTAILSEGARVPVNDSLSIEVPDFKVDFDCTEGYSPLPQVLYTVTLYETDLSEGSVVLTPFDFKSIGSWPKTLAEADEKKPFVEYNPERGELVIAPLVGHQPAANATRTSYVAYISATILGESRTTELDPIPFSVQWRDHAPPEILDFVDFIEVAHYETLSDVLLGTITYEGPSEVVVTQPLTFKESSFVNTTVLVTETFRDKDEVRVTLKGADTLQGKSSFAHFSIGAPGSADETEYTFQVFVLKEEIEEVVEEVVEEEVQIEVTEEEEPVFVPDFEPPILTPTFTFTAELPRRSSKVKINIKAPTSDGRLDLDFSRKVRLPLTAKAWSSDNEGVNFFRIEYRPTEETQIVAESVNMKIQLSWRVIYVDATNSQTIKTGRRLASEVPSIGLADIEHLQLQLDFTDPLYVSQSRSEMDTLEIEILPALLEYDGVNVTYTTQVNGDNQKDGSALVEVPRQMTEAELNVLEAMMTAAETSVQLIASSNIFASVIFSSLIQYLWGLVNALQIMLPTALFSIMLPSNAQTMMFSIMRMSNLDIFNVESAWRSIATIEENAPFNAIFDFAGYNTTNFVIESGTLLFLIMAFAVYFIVRFLLRTATRSINKENCFLTRLRKHKNHTGTVVRFLLEGCLELGLVSAMCLIKMEEFGLNVLLAIVLLIILLLTPIYLGVAAKRVYKAHQEEAASQGSEAEKSSNEVVTPVPDKTILAKPFTIDGSNAGSTSGQTPKVTEQQKAMQLSNTLFSGLRSNSLFALSFNIVFMVRRLFIIAALTLLVNYRNCQIFGYVMASLLTFVYLSLARPFDARINNWQEKVNETFVLIVGYHLFCFTDYVQSLRTEFAVGWSIILVILVSLLFNICVFIFMACHESKRSCRRRAARKAQQRRQEIFKKSKLLQETSTPYTDIYTAPIALKQDPQLIEFKGKAVPHENIPLGKPPQQVEAIITQKPLLLQPKSIVVERKFEKIEEIRRKQKEIRASLGLSLTKGSSSPPKPDSQDQLLRGREQHDSLFIKSFGEIVPLEEQSPLQIPPKIGSLQTSSNALLQSFTIKSNTDLESNNGLINLGATSAGLQLSPSNSPSSPNAFKSQSLVQRQGDFISSLQPAAPSLLLRDRRFNSIDKIELK